MNPLVSCISIMALKFGNNLDSWPEYWEERRKTEKAEKVEEAKQHWQSQAARFMGI